MKRTKMLVNLNQKIIKCERCPRLVSHRQNIAKEKTRRFRGEKYWGKPLSGFGDPNAELLLIGLAPAAHGGNRTGRMFTGDCSGDWVAKVLFEKGFATRPTSKKIGDGFSLINAYITAAARCAPPKNKPLKDELENCSTYLKDEIFILKNIRVIICLGRIAFESCCKLLHVKDRRFVHGKTFSHGKWIIISSYHPSRQNTQTGRLTWNQWQGIFSKARKVISETK